MKKHIIILSSLAFLTVIVILICIFLFNVPHFAQSDITLQRDIANMPNADAARIALNDSRVREQLADHVYDNRSYNNNIYRFEPVSITSEGYDFGFINPSDNYRQVQFFITSTRGEMYAIRLLVTVDMTEKKVAVIQPIHLIAWAPEIYAVVPPGKAWYHPANIMIGSVNVGPDNASDYVAVFPADQFINFKSGSSYNACVYDDGRAGWVWTADAFAGNVSGRSVPYFSPAVVSANQSPYYLVVKNAGTSDITVDATA